MLGSLLLATALATGVVVGAPYALRYAAERYLASQGLHTTIDAVHLDWLTGEIVVENARGQTDDGRGFQIGRLAVDIAYAPLFDQRVIIDSLSLRNAHLDITRTPADTWRIAGIDLPTEGNTASGQSSAWQIAAHSVVLQSVRLDYHQPPTSSRPGVERTVSIDHATTTHLVAWQPQTAVPFDIALTTDGGHVQVAGQIWPFQPNLKLDARVSVADFSLDTVSPWAASAGFSRLAGRVSAKEQIQLTWQPDQQLAVATTGQTTLDDLTVTQGTDLHTRLKRLAWQGEARLSLPMSGQTPGEIHTDGEFTVAGLVTQQPGNFRLAASRARWQGQGVVTLDDALQLSTHGTYSDNGLSLTAADRLKLTADSEHLSGYIETTLADDRTTVVSDGRYRAQKLAFDVPDTVAIDTARIDWQGTTQTTLDAKATRIDTHGRLDSRTLAFTIPQTSRFKAAAINWQGNTHVESAALFQHEATGRLVADEAQLDLTDMPLDFTSQRLIFDGRYGQYPNAAGDALVLRTAAEVVARKMRAMDTRIHAPWVSVLQARATDLDIDSLADIRLGHLKTSGLRLLGDTDTSSAVLQAVTFDADDFALADYRHYRVDQLTLGEALVHTRRDADGMGVISEYLDSLSAGSSTSASAATSPDADTADTSSTYAVKHLHITGPSIWFVDTTTTPNVRLHGMDLDFTLDNLDTAHPNQNASYRLSMDVGAYGHFDSQGTVAPLAPGGVTMDINAWLRSLAMPPLSGYLNAAMGRGIGRGAIDGTLDVTADAGQLDGTLAATITNFRLADDDKTTEIALGINMETALALIRGEDDTFQFQTKLLGDVTNPYFSVDNLVREAVLAGLRNALLSNYSPIGLINKGRNAFLNLFRSVQDRPAYFASGKHYVRPDDRHYLALIANAMARHGQWTLTIQALATRDEIGDLMRAAPTRDADAEQRLRQLAREREEAIRDYLAARGVSPHRIVGLAPQVVDEADVKPQVRFTLDKHDK